MLKEKISEEMKSALKAKDTLRLSTLRMLFSALRQREIDERKTLSDEEVEALIAKMIKERRESEKIYREADRADLADKEKGEVAVLQEFLPEPLSASEITAAIQTALADTGATKMADMGRVMNLLKTRLAGRADFASVSREVKAALQ